MHCIQEVYAMGMLTIRNVDDELKGRLRLKAVEAGCSVEETVRVILRQATAANAPSITPTGADAPRLAARRRLLARLAQQPALGPITWTRDELYD
jgi:plasmid stability protein